MCSGGTRGDKQGHGARFIVGLVSEAKPTTSMHKKKTYQRENPNKVGTQEKEKHVGIAWVNVERLHN